MTGFKQVRGCICGLHSIYNSRTGASLKFAGVMTARASPACLRLFSACAVDQQRERLSLSFDERFKLCQVAYIQCQCSTCALTNRKPFVPDAGLDSEGTHALCMASSTFSENYLSPLYSAGAR